MSVEKGQKYLGTSSDAVYEILTDPFMDGDVEKVVYRSGNKVDICNTWPFERFTLIREPKFKVGDRVTYCDGVYEIVCVSPDADKDGDFAYIGRNNEGYHAFIEDCYSSLKAAE